MVADDTAYKNAQQNSDKQQGPKTQSRGRLIPVEIGSLTGRSRASHHDLAVGRAANAVRWVSAHPAAFFFCTSYDATIPDLQAIRTRSISFWVGFNMRQEQALRRAGTMRHRAVNETSPGFHMEYIIHANMV